MRLTWNVGMGIVVTGSDSDSRQHRWLPDHFIIWEPEWRPFTKDSDHFSQHCSGFIKTVLSTKVEAHDVPYYTTVKQKTKLLMLFTIVLGGNIIWSITTINHVVLLWEMIKGTKNLNKISNGFNIMICLEFKLKVSLYLRCFIDLMIIW